MSENQEQKSSLGPEWAWWEELLRTGQLQPLQDGAVHFGYYRRPATKKAAGNRWVPIGVFPNKKGEVIVEIDGKKNARKRPFDAIFSKYLQAIGYNTYLDVTRRGKPWPDAPPALEMSVPASDREVALTDNMDPLTRYQRQLIEEKVLVNAWLEKPVSTQEQANAASEWANRIASLAGWFQAEYDQRNRPLLDEQKKLREIYLHPAQEAKNLANIVTQHTADFLLEKQRRLIAEAKAAAMPAVVPEEPKARAGGLTGRQTTVTEANLATVHNYLEFAAYLIHGQMVNAPADYCSSPEVKKVLDERAAVLARKLPKDHKLPGLTITTRAKARR